MHYMRVKTFVLLLFILLLSNREKISISVLPYTVSKHLLSLYMLTWHIFDFFLSRQLIQILFTGCGFFTSKTYVYPMKIRNLLAKKLELFHRDIQPKRDQTAKNEKMRLQKDLEFRQKEIKKLNKKYKK